MRHEPSRAERALWNILRDRRLSDFKFRRQHPIDRYIADFACVKAKVVIEIDGPSHSLPDQIEHDWRRTSALENLGWRVLRLTDDEVLTDASETIAKISNFLCNSPSP